MEIKRETRMLAFLRAPPGAVSDHANDHDRTLPHWASVMYAPV